MAGEIRITSSYQINKAPLVSYSQPGSFVATLNGTKGPSPGVLSVPITGLNVDLSKLTQPGICRIVNLDATNYLTAGIWDPDTLIFYPFIEILPGEFYVFRLSRNLQSSESGAGTVVLSDKSLRLLANSATINCIVEAFDS